jgi:hypothetical protein
MSVPPAETLEREVGFFINLKRNQLPNEIRAT